MVVRRSTRLMAMRLRRIWPRMTTGLMLVIVTGELPLVQSGIPPADHNCPSESMLFPTPQGREKL
jgi:hypothetical protein